MAISEKNLQHFAIPVKDNLKKIVESCSTTTKRIFIAGFIFLAYGYLCRLIHIYFFWETKTIGWELLLIAGMSYLSNKINSKKQTKKDSLPEKVGIGFIIFLLLVQIIFLIYIPRTVAYDAAKKYIIANKDKYDLGDIQGFSLVPIGGMAMAGEAGDADITLIAKGSDRYKEFNLHLSKNITTDWQIQIINIF
ncbi:MAG TPA: hypothetical protein VK559_13465 [Ferruginibacter sp.]|nr:hypothetical protein [Ferruginibacter sp.]